MSPLPYDAANAMRGLLRARARRRRAEAALRESESKFSIAFDRSPLALTITSLHDGRLIDVNEGFVRMSGFTREEAIGRAPEELGLWVDPSIRAERFARLRQGLPVPEIEAVFRLKNNEERIGVVGSAVVDINGQPCVLSSVVDITERKAAEEALRASEARIREFADTAPAMLWISEPDGAFSFLSRGWYDFTGQTEAQSLGLGWLDAVHPDDRETALTTIRKAAEGLEPFAFDYRIRGADGEYRWAMGSGRPRLSATGELLGYIGSVIDITDRKRAEQAKDEFLATLSHELRTPLTSAFGWIKLLGKTREPDMLATGLRAIEESLVDQIRLIDDLLDISRIAAGKMRIDLQPLDLGSVIDSAVETIRPAAQAKGIDLRMHAQSVVTIAGDSARLRQLVWNLLSNAIKFTPSGGRVDVELRPRDDVAEIGVRDTGDGIDGAFLPHVFDRFRQADSSISRRHGGLGIGLSIVSSIAAAHDGVVHAASDGLGKGATFTVTLPLLAPVARPVPASRDVPVSRNLRGARVLVVDDDPGALQLMTTTLAAAGADVRECSSAREAFALLSEWPADILVSDLAMPQEDGYALLRRLRSTGNDVPALAVTAYVRTEDEARVRAAGFHRHLAKPFDPEDLVRTVRELAK